MNCKKIPDASIFGRDPSVHAADLVPGPRHCNCHCTGYDAFQVGYIIISYLFLFNIFYWLAFEQKRHFPRESWFPVQHVWEGLFQRPSHIIPGWKLKKNLDIKNDLIKEPFQKKYTVWFS